MQRLVFIFLLIIGFGFSTEYLAQSGGRKKEHRNQRRSGRLFGPASKGNADKFSRGTGRKGLMARLFKKDRPAWVYHETRPSKVQKREQRYLFSRYRTKGKKYNSGVLTRQNADRSKRRTRGNAVFARRKYS